MTRILAILACIGLLIQASIKMVYSQGGVQPDEYMIVGLVFSAPILSLLALVRATGWGLLGDIVSRLRIEEQVRIETARAALAAARKTNDQ